MTNNKWWWVHLGWGSFVPEHIPVKKEIPASRIFMRVISPEGMTVDLLGSCNFLEIENEFAVFLQRPYGGSFHGPNHIKAFLKNDFIVSAYRIMEGQGEDRHLVNGELPTDQELQFGVSHTP